MDPRNVSQLVETYGSIQTSRQHIAILNAGPVAKFVSNSDVPGTTPAGYRVLLSGYAEFIQRKESSHNDYDFLDRLLILLRSVPRHIDSSQLKGSASTFQLKNERFRVDYRIANGEVMIYNIQPLDKLQQARDRLEQPALYNVAKNGQGLWELGGKATRVSTSKAAVNGQSNNLAKATWLMGEHLEAEFPSIKEYTLFHNPSVGGAGDTWESMRDKMGFTTPVTKQYAKILTDTHTAGNATEWLVHSQGGAIFAEAVRYILNDGSSSALHNLRLNGVRNPDIGTILNTQKVIFHANANNNMRSSILFKRAGIGTRIAVYNDYDLVPNLTGFNTLNPRKLIGSLVYANHVTGGSVAQSPHTTFQNQEAWEQQMQNGPGKGRGIIQKAFQALTSKQVKVTPNHLP